jgi:hypothetical protein
VAAIARFAAFLLLGCTACETNVVAFTEQVPTGPNLNCSYDPECLATLVCAWNRCHEPCETSHDCRAGERCMQVRSVDDGGTLVGHACQLPDEARCVLNSQCPGVQICGIDERCRDSCKTAQDCGPSQVCAAHTCADPGELDDAGALAPVDAGSNPG